MTVRHRSYLRSFALVTAGIIFTGIVIILIFPVGLLSPFGRAGYALEHWWAATLVRMAGMKLKVRGTEKIASDRTYVFVANHQSLFDIPVLMYCLPKQIRLIHKKELLWIPMLGQILMVTRFISIDRGNREKAMASLKRAARKISQGVNIAIFAEGTRSLDGELRPFKNGAFVLAIDAQVDIVPVTISGTINVLHKNQSIFNIAFHRDVEVIVGEPISTHGRNSIDRDLLRDQVEKTIAAEYAAVKHLSVPVQPGLAPVRNRKAGESLPIRGEVS